jgi:HK97 family phage major capsid protein
MTFKKNDKGEIILTDDEFTAFADEIGQKAVDAMVKRYKLDQAPETPPGSPKPGAVGPEKYDPPENETRHAKMRRLEHAVLDIRGGKLRYEDAPKEIKTIAFFRALADGDMATVKALSLTAADGGNLVPKEFGTDLIVAIEEYQAIADCTQHRMTATELDLSTVTTKPIVYQVSEGAQITEAAPKFGRPQLVAKAFAGIVPMSKEIFQDNNVGLYDKLIVLFTEALTAKMSMELFIGSAFTGIFGSATPQTVTLLTNSIKEVTYQKLVDLSVSLSPGQLAKGGKFYMHRTTWGCIQGIVDLNGRPIVENPWDPKNKTLLGFPVVLDEAITSTDAADTAFICFGNLTWVDFGMRQDITAQILREGTIGSINLAEKRSLGLVVDTRWGLVVSLPANLAMLKTKA